MPIKRYDAEKDATIANAYKPDNKNVAYDSNTGAADSLEVYSILGKVSPSSLEKSRIVLQFPIDKIIADRLAGKIPSADVKYMLNLYNVEHGESTPRNFDVTIAPLSQSWEEGYGLDLDNYTDLGARDPGVGIGATWRSANQQEQWGIHGGTIVNNLNYIKTFHFESGLEDIKLDITSIVSAWISGSIPNYGLLIRLNDQYENGLSGRSFYTKKFSARTSQYFFKRPKLDILWEEQIQDNRKNFFRTSPAVSDSDNTMNLYYYNRVNGVLKNLPGSVVPNVAIYADAALTQQLTASFSQVTNPYTGMYRLQTRLYTTSEKIYDVWRNPTTSSIVYSTGVAEVYARENNLEEVTYIPKILDMKTGYSGQESIRFKIQLREKNWKPNILTVYSDTVDNECLNDLHYRIVRVFDDFIVIDYSQDDVKYTKCGSDDKGNYFDFDMSILEPGYIYKIKLARINEGTVDEFKEEFKFRVY